MNTPGAKWVTSSFDPGRGTPQARLAVGEFLRTYQVRTAPDLPPLSAEREAQGLLHLMPGVRARLFVVQEEGMVVGLAHLEWHTEQNPHLGLTQRLLVHPDWRGRGIGSQLWEAVQDTARLHGLTALMAYTSSRAPDGERFAEKRGLKLTCVNRSSRLNLHDVPPGLSARWRDRPAGEPYRLHRWTLVPQEWMDRLMDLVNACPAPRSDPDSEDMQFTPVTYRAWERQSVETGQHRHVLAVEDARTGELVAYTITLWSPDRAALIEQADTGVRPGHRGKGLAKWVKAAMLDILRSDCPGAESIRTGNAEQNAAMLAVNEAMGFRPWMCAKDWKCELK